MAGRANKNKDGFRRRTTGNRRLPSSNEERLVRLSQAHHLLRVVTTVTLVICAAVALFILSLKGYEKMVKSPKLMLKTVHIVGNKELSEKEVLTTGMIKKGTPILELDPAAIAAKLAAHPWIRDVNVQRQLPDRMLIEISERTPMAVIALEKLYFVDDEGFPFVAAPLSAANNFPLITGIEKQFFMSHKEDAESLVKLAFNTMALIKNSAAFKGYKIEEVHCNTFSGIEVEFAPGPLRINLGYGNYNDKLDRAARVLATLKQQSKKARILYLDNDKQRQLVVAKLAGR